MLAYNGLHSTHNTGRPYQPAHYAVRETVANDEIPETRVILPLESASEPVNQHQKKEVWHRAQEKPLRKSETSYTVPTQSETQAYYQTRSNHPEIDQEAQRRADDDLAEVDESTTEEPATDIADAKNEDEITIPDHTPLPLEPITFPDPRESRDAEIQSIKRSIEQHEKSRNKLKEYDITGTPSEVSPSELYGIIDADKRYQEIMSMIGGTDNLNTESTAKVSEQEIYKIVENNEEQSESSPSTVATYIVKKNPVAEFDSKPDNDANLPVKQHLRLPEQSGAGCGSVYSNYAAGNLFLKASEN